MITYSIVTSYRITCHEADKYFWLCRVNREKPTVDGLTAYAKAGRA